MKAAITDIDDIITFSGPWWRQFAYIHKVVCHSGHKLSGLMIVIKAERQFFEMREHIAAHLCLQMYAHNVTVVLNEVV